MYKRSKLHKLPEVTALQRFFKLFSVDCVFDVGANAGQYAKMLRNDVRFEGIIFSFEPIPELAERLKEAAKRDPKWFIFDFALSDSAGETIFNIMRNDQFSSFGTPTSDETDECSRLNQIERSVHVQKKTLNNVFPILSNQYAFKKPFLKMDTQGFDISVAKGASEVITNFLGIQSELSFKKIYAEAVDYKEAISFYENCGFELSALFQNNAGHFPHLLEMDCMMVNRSMLIPSHKQTISS
ncbi:FkbM family methyltransferase [Falsihalocynthiibacter sp. S25ZX9]|uniref:FkbM family methyltransferase n=1 Tax=Falsihalocynthiibacter sp. S25ZX9 TaxID=3240870 RepID=UPI00350FE135